MLFADKLTLDKPRRTADGFLIVRAKAARTGVYQYDGGEVDPGNKHGLRDAGLVNVLREPAAVFDKKAVHSFIGKPITVDHPSQPVTADNWKDHAGGTVMGAMRDGEHLAFDLLFTDSAAISAVDSGKRELSAGYATDLEFGDFTASDGTKCAARQTTIRGNHVALVDRGRAGSECAIADAARCSSLPADIFDLLTDERTYSDENRDGINGGSARRETSDPSGGGNPVRDGEVRMPHTLIIDGLQVPNVSDEAKAAIEKLQLAAKDAVDGRAADKTAHDKALAAKDAEIDALKGKVVDQAQIDALADAKAAVVAAAKSVAGEKLGDTAGKSVADVRRMACAAVLGDAAVADKSDDYIEARFDTLKDGKPEHRDPVRDAIAGGLKTNVNDHGAGVRDVARSMQYN